MAAMTHKDIEKLKPMAPCKVRRKLAGRGYTFLDGNIKEASAKGCFVITKHDGKSNFYRWTEIEFPLDAPKPTVAEAKKKPLATLADVLEPALKVVRPPLPASALVVAPAPKPVDRPYLDTTPQEEPKPINIRMSTDEPARPPKAPEEPHLVRKRGGWKRTPQKHDLTAIGLLLRTERMRHGWSQKRVALETGLTFTRISCFELGEAVPKEFELKLFADLFDISIDILLEAASRPSDQTQLPAVVQEPPDEVPLEAVLTPDPEPEPEPEPEPVQQVTIPSPPPPPVVASAPDNIEAFQGFVDQLDAIVPMPRDREKRAEWFAAAKALFKMKE